MMPAYEQMPGGPRLSEAGFLIRKQKVYIVKKIDEKVRGGFMLDAPSRL